MLGLSRFFFVLAIFFSVLFHVLKRYAVIGWLAILLMTAVATFSGANPYLALAYSTGVGLLIAIIGTIGALNKPW